MMDKARWLMVLGYAIAALMVWVILVQTAVGDSARLSVDASDPVWEESGAPISTNVLASTYVRIYGAKQGQPKVLRDAAPWAPSLKFSRDKLSPGIHCYDARLAIDRTGDGIPDIESPPGNEWCGTAEDPEAYLTPGAPRGLTGEIVRP